MKRPCFILMILASFCAATSAQNPWLEQHLPEVIRDYQHLHTHPELSFEEKETAAYLARIWRTAGFTVTEKIGGHGLVALLANGKGPTVMLRTDMDALPVTERTELPYASTRIDPATQSGIMHACGHDLHMANLIGVSRYLAEHRTLWAGTLMLIGQPAEERGAGSKAMLDDGLFERFPKPDYALAMHVSATLPTGTVRMRPGFSNANVDSVDITMKGRGGHGAYPHTTIDPIVQAAHLVMDLQTIVSREIAPADSAVITVGSIHGGTKHNVIGDTCTLQLTVRSHTNEVREQLKEAIVRKAKAAAVGAHAPEPEIQYSEGTPALYNHPDLARRLAVVLENATGQPSLDTSKPSMGGEDFSRYGRAGVPILMIGLGSIHPDRLAKFKKENRIPPSLHSALYHPDVEATLRTSIPAMSTAAIHLMPATQP